ncbi:MAG: glycosyltransferase, partial [Actinomycetota bacterium]
MNIASASKVKIKLRTTVYKMPTVSISIVTWNSAGEIRDCLSTLADLPHNWEVWVIDNNSSDDTVEIVRREFTFVKLIANPDNKGFA